MCTLLHRFLRHLHGAIASLGLMAGFVPTLAAAQECQTPCFDGGGILVGLDYAAGIIGILQGDPESIVSAALSRILVFLALLCVITIIIAGFFLILGLGEESSRDRAKRIVLYTVIGLLIILLADQIVDVVYYVAGQGPEGPLRSSIVAIVARILNFLALVAVIVIIIAGMFLILSLGEEAQKDRAKHIIIYTLIGLLIILFSRIIVGFITEYIAEAA